MNLQFYLEKLFASEKFKSFVKENPSAYFCSGFFSIDKEDKGNKIHIDYVIPETKKIFSFQLENMSSAPKGVPPHSVPGTRTSDEVPSVEGDINIEGALKSVPSIKGDINIEGIPVEQSGDVVLERISDNIDFDFEEIEKMIVEKMEEKEMKNKIQKILLSLQKIDKRDFLVGTIFISGLGMIKIKIDLEEKLIVKFEKKSFFDMMKIIKKD
ncbi:hypothetical protein KAT80_02305 [Candidatus Pacearchaeota archaeon]|nr:hypothetical protein [Candidatus Pacearchaeota archaeon]